MPPIAAADVQVRPISEQDLPAFAPFERSLDAVRAALQQSVDGALVVLAAYGPDGPEGRVTVDFTPGEMEPEMHSMLVYPAYRRTGVGVSLAEAVESLVRQRSYTEIFLGVDPENFQAIPLYLALGYEPTGDHRLYASQDEAGEPITYHDAIYRKSLLRH